MNKKLIGLAIASALTLPTAAGAYEILGSQLVIYGKVHVSADMVDNGAEDNVSLSSNSSRLGFKGETDINGLTALFQYEQKVVVDESGGNLASRNSYVGLKGGFGRVIAGYHDTPVKDVSRKYFDIFGDTVGDARSVLDEFNTRAKNVLMYSNKIDAIGINAMYSTAWDGQAVNGQDNNENDLVSLSGTFNQGPIAFALGYEQVSQPSPADDDTALRMGLQYTMDAIKVGLLWEDIEVGGADRTGYGINGAFKAGDNVFKAQYVIADELNGAADTGASQLSLGVDHKLAKNTTVYAMYTNLSNDDAASFSIAGGHDSDKYAPSAAGEDVSAFSLGLVYKF